MKKSRVSGPVAVSETIAALIAPGPAAADLRAQRAQLLRRQRMRIGVSFVAAGVLFLAGGALHPSDSGTGTKIEQLYEMLVDTKWYPSHALLALAIALFTVGIALLRRREQAMGIATLLNVAVVVGVIATVGMTVHLLQELNASALEGGEGNLFSTVQAVNETVVDPFWTLTIGAVAVFGGLRGLVGNRVLAPVGAIGAACFAIASATIAFTDTFDPLFAVGGVLIALWAVASGVGLLVTDKR